MRYLNSVWDIIKSAVEKNLELGDIIKQDYKNNDVNQFFQSLQNEIGFNNYKDLSKYDKYIDFIYKAFENSFETTGGKRVRFFHSMYVATTAEKISNILQISESEKEIAVLASILHDIGKSHPIYRTKGISGYKEFEKEHNIDHEKIGAEMVFDILKNDFSVSKIETIANTIIDKEHNEIYSKILHDADNLSELGRMEIHKSFYYNASDKQDINTTIAYWYEENSAIKLKKINSSQIQIAKDMMMDRYKIIFDVYDQYKINRPTI